MKDRGGNFAILCLFRAAADRRCSQMARITAWVTPDGAIQFRRKIDDRGRSGSETATTCWSDPGTPAELRPVVLAADRIDAAFQPD